MKVNIYTCNLLYLLAIKFPIVPEHTNNASSIPTILAAVSCNTKNQ